MANIGSDVYVHWCKNSCQNSFGSSKCFQVKVGTHQSSAPSPLLFVIVMIAVFGKFRVAFPWEQLYADDLVVIAETDDDLIKRLNEWNGMIVNMNTHSVQCTCCQECSGIKGSMSKVVIYLWRLLESTNQYRWYQCRYWCQCKSGGYG